MNFCVVALGILIGQFWPGLGSSVSRQCVGVSCGDGAICVATSRLGASCKTVSTKPGLCPASPKNAECLNLRGAPLCFFDTDCSGTRKCCRGCCEQAVTQKQLDRNRLDRTRKPGVCPDTYEFVDVFWWTDLFCPDRGYIDDCQNDEECPGPDKCCPGLCGKECTRIKFDAERPPSPTTAEAATATETTTAATVTSTTEATTATETSTTEATTATETSSEASTATVTEMTTTAQTTVSEQATVQSNATGELNATAVENSSFNASHYANKTSDIVEGLDATDSVDIDETLSVQSSSNASAFEQNSTTTADPTTTLPAQSSTTPPASATASTESADLSGTQSTTETTQTTSSTTTETTTSKPQSTESTTEGRSEAQAVGS